MLRFAHQHDIEAFARIATQSDVAEDKGGGLNDSYGLNLTQSERLVARSGDSLLSD